MDKVQIECIASSLVREYLSRKGLKTTLQVMDEEMPRVEGSISNRQQLMKELHIEKLMKKNKELESPLKAMIEIMTKYFMEKTENGLPVDGNKKQKQQTKALDGFPATNISSDTPYYGSQSNSYSVQRSQLSTASSTTVPDNVDISDVRRSDRPRAQTAKESTRGNVTQYKDLVIEDNLESETLVGTGKAGILDQEEVPDYVPVPKTQTRPRSSRHKGLSGPISSNLEEPSRRKFHKPRPVSAGNRGNQKLNLFSTTLKDETNEQTKSNRKDLDNTSSDCRGRLSPADNKISLTNSSNVDYLINEQRKTSIKDVLELESEKPKPAIRRQSSSELKHYDVDISSISERPPTRGGNPVGRPTSSSLKTSNTSKVGDVEIGDMDDLDEDVANLDLGPRLPVYKPIQNTVDAKPIDLNTAVALKTLIFGAGNLCFNDEWKYQCFNFCDIPKLKYGIVQKKGGPCGVTASVQACMLLELLFGETKVSKSRYSDPTREERTTCLAVALSKIFWRAGQQKCAVVVIPSGRSQIQGISNKFKPDDITETLMLNRFQTYEELQSFMTQCINQFEVDGGTGVILALYSTILSRSIDLVKKDMDEPTGKLMGAHGYCTQEMVNLLLTGRAVSNVFNDVMELDSGDGSAPMILKGLNARSDIGLLSLFEHYRSCQVGTFYKTPKYPIWVVCSESHFSVLFSIKKELINDWKAERRFELFYYDGLARQQEEIKLTIDTTNRFYQAPTDEELVPPLNYCIRTKWKDAEIDWNETEPLL